MSLAVERLQEDEITQPNPDGRRPRPFCARASRLTRTRPKRAPFARNSRPPTGISISRTNPLLARQH